jgi:hypothetical protein
MKALSSETKGGIIVIISLITCLLIVCGGCQAQYDNANKSLHIRYSAYTKITGNPHKLTFDEWMQIGAPTK